MRRVSKEIANRRLHMLALLVLGLLSSHLVMSPADGARVRKETTDTATETASTDIPITSEADIEIFDAVHDVVTAITPGAAPSEDSAPLPPNMELACHRHINGSLWCAPMEKYDVDQVATGSSSQLLDNLITQPDEYGTGFSANIFGEFRERPAKNDSTNFALRTLDVPDSFSWFPEYVSPVKHQGKCGSCVAFASMGAVETCFRRVTGKFGDYSVNNC